MCGLQINWAMNDKQEFIDVVEVVYRGARKGRGLVVSPKGRGYVSVDSPLSAAYKHELLISRQCRYAMAVVRLCMSPQRFPDLV